MSLHGVFAFPEVRKRIGRTLAIVLTLVTAPPATAGVLIRVFPETLPAGSALRPQVHQIARIDDEIWIAADNGVYRAVGHRLEPVLPGVPARVVGQVGDAILVGATDGLRVHRINEWVRLPFPAGANSRCGNLTPLDIPVVALAERDGTAWLGTDCGLARWDGETVSWFDDAPVTALRRVGRDLWVGGAGGVYRIDATGQKVSIDVGPVRIERIDYAAGAVWLVASSGGPGSFYDRLLRVEGEQAIRVHEEDFRFVNRVVSIRADGPGAATLQPGGPTDRAWLATNAGVFEYGPSGAHPIAIQELDEAVNTIAEWDDLPGRRIRWVGSSQRAYRQVDEKLPEVIPTPHPMTRRYEINVKDIVFAAGATWLRTDDDVFRYDEGVSLFVQPKTVSIAGVQVLFGRTLSLAEYGYRDETGADPYSGAVSGDVALALHWQRSEYEAALLRPLTPASDFQRQLPLGYWTLWYRAADEFGNVTEERRSGIWVIPWYVLVPVLTFCGWLLLAVGLIVMASRSPLVMRWLQDKRARRWTLLFVLSWRRMQRLLLRPYRRGVAPRFEGAAKRGFQFVDPATSEPTSRPAAAARLAKERSLKLIVPPSLRAEECLDALAGFLVADGEQSIHRSVPIVVEVRDGNESGTRMEDAALAELSRKGGITDPELGKYLLRSGGFVFLLDAAGRLGNPGPVTAVRDFVDRNGPPMNFLVLGIGAGEGSNLLLGAPSIRVEAADGDPGTAAASEPASSPRKPG